MIGIILCWAALFAFGWFVGSLMPFSERKPRHFLPYSLITRMLAPGYGTCGRCGVPWAFTSPHVTPLNEPDITYGRGLFPLCVECWNTLKMGERLPYYRELFEQYHKNRIGGANWQDIEKAVLAGR